MPGFITPELVGSFAAAAIPSAAYAWRVWVARKERAEQRAAIERHADNPLVLAALAKIEVPSADLKGPISLLFIAAAAGTLAANASLAAPLVGVELPSQALGAELRGPRDPRSRCNPKCQRNEQCIANVCTQVARPAAPKLEDAEAASSPPKPGAPEQPVGPQSALDPVLSAYRWTDGRNPFEVDPDF